MAAAQTMYYSIQSDGELGELGERCGTGKKAGSDEHRRDEASFAESSLSRVARDEFIYASTTLKL